MRYKSPLIVSIFVILLLISSVSAALTSNPKNSLISNAVIDVGQISVFNAIITGGVKGYTSNWFYIVPSTATNIVSGNLPQRTVGITPPQNNLIFIFNAVSPTQLNVQTGTNVVQKILISTNAIYGSYRANFIVGSPNLITLNTLKELSINTLTINPAYTATSVVASNAVVDWGQSETFTFTW
ncbi:MAG: hypothetical protein KGH71_00005, partial [Candidatus Micrarchaeota archaeon]|nr:hypothetical protein [Candidatus Micrarchaeota archaeon]